jgi:hypothetical protein
LFGWTRAIVSKLPKGRARSGLQLLRRRSLCARRSPEWRLRSQSGH